VELTRGDGKWSSKGGRCLGKLPPDVHANGRQDAKVETRKILEGRIGWGVGALKWSNGGGSRISDWLVC